MREPGFWHRPSSLDIASTEAARRTLRRDRRAAPAARGLRCRHSRALRRQLSSSAAPARRRPCWRWQSCCASSARRRSCSAAAMADRLRGPVRVDPAQARGRRCRRRAADAGAHACRWWSRAIASDGVALAQSQGASVILMDDGFQNPAVAKDASLIVIDSERGLGNGQVFPAGPLRAPLPPQLARTDALIVVGERRRCRARLRPTIAAQGKPVLSAHLEAGRCAAWRSCAASACWPLPASAIPRDSSGTLRASGIDVVRAARLRRSSSVFASRDRSPDRRGQARWADAGDDGKGSGAAARQRARGKASCRSAVTLEFDDARAVAEVRDRSAVQGAREEDSRNCVGWARRRSVPTIHDNARR